MDASIISLADDETTETTDDETTTEEDDPTNFDCLEIILPYLTEADAEFSEFLGDSVTSEEPSSEIVDLMIEKYEAYLDDVDSVFVQAITADGGENLSTVTERLSVCQAKVEEHIEANEQILEAEVVSSSYAKKTTALLDEYKWINERLRDMQETVGYIGGYLTTVDGQLSGFTKTCIKQ